ncbi:MAG: serine hydrolase [Bacteroidota bacterium]|nr:serine hydrolase [Bacteroidota bacterium]
MKKHRILKISGGIILFLIVIYLILPFHLKQGIKYFTPDIDDYKIFSNNTVKAGNYQAWKISENINKQKLDNKYLKEFEKLETKAFLVIQNKEIQYEKYWDSYNENSYSNSFSMAKTIVSLLIGIAIDEGKIKSVNQAVGDFIDNFNNGENAELTIKDLLTMSSALDWDERYASPFSKTTKLYYGKNIEEFVLKLDVVEEPGKEFKYYSCNTQILASILKKVTGKSLSTYASEKIWQVIGAKNDALWSTDKKGGTEKAYCCFNSNARDYARLGQLVLNNGKWNEKQVISKKYIKEASSPATYLKTKKGKEVNFYGYQFWIINHKGFEIPYFRGILGQYIFIIPHKNAVVVRLGEKRDKKSETAHPQDVFMYLDATMDILK